MLLAACAVAAGLLQPSAWGAPPRPAPGVARAPRVSLWLEREGPYRPGERVHVFVAANEGAYLAVLRADTDGGLRVLFPREPWQDGYVPLGRALELRERAGAEGFEVDDAPGIGYVFAIAAAAPLAYERIAGGFWDPGGPAGGRLRGDPYVAASALADRIAPGGYDYDIVPYSVGRAYPYPRFVCYDCHSAARYAGWDPYRDPCSRYRIVIYDDPDYYPYRAYGGRVVGPARPPRLAPRFVFRESDGRSEFVTRARRRVEHPAPIRSSAGEGDGSPPGRLDRASRTTGEPVLRRRLPDREERTEP